MSPDWSRSGGGASYLGAIRTRALPLVALVSLTVGVAVVYSIVADKRYGAHAEILVTPLPEDPAFVGLGSAAQPRAAETVARLVESRPVAEAVATKLADTSGKDLLDAVDARAVGDSDIVAVNANASEAARAAQIANGFADEFVRRRSARFQRLLAARVQRLRENLGAIPAARRDTPRAVSLDEQLARLTPLVGEGDPTLEVVSDAVASDEPRWPKPWLIVPLAALLALALGALIAALPLARARRAARGEATPAGERTSRAQESDAAFDRRVADEVGRRLELERVQAAPTARRAEVEAKPDLEERTRKLDEHERKLKERERALDAARVRDEQRVAELARREAALADRLAELAAAEQALAPPAPIAPPLSQTGPPQPVRDREWNLNELERLVAERSTEYPQRREEWSSYLFFLREHAGPDGALPTSLDWLIADVFQELLE